MSFESFDTINHDELQATIEAELLLYENCNSGNTYTNLENSDRFQQQQEVHVSLQQQQEVQSSPQRTRQSPSRHTTSTSPLQHHSIEKKQRSRHSVEFKAKILADLQNSSQADLARRYNIDRRLIGKWARPENKEKIQNVVGKRGTFRIETESKSWWPELENGLFNWFKEKR